MMCSGLQYWNDIHIKKITMAEIKPDEISAILRQQLSTFHVGADLEEVGTVLQVGDGIARVYGLNNVRSGELVEFENGVKAIALNLEEDNRKSRYTGRRDQGPVRRVEKKPEGNNNPEA